MKRFIRKTLAVALIISLTVPSSVSFSYAEIKQSREVKKTGVGENTATTGKVEKNQKTDNIHEPESVPNQVVVKFENGAVKDKKMSIKKARKMDNISKNYGKGMAATGEKKEAARDAKSQVNIVVNSLGEDFVIEETVSFDEKYTIALVSSDRFDTQTMIEKLSQNPKVESVEPNYYIEPASYEYSVNDPLNCKNSAFNSQSGKNISGESTYKDLEDQETTASVNAGYIWNKLDEKSKKNDGKNDEELVVAVVDTGVDTNHEDLKNVMWTNPGNIGLKGEHGYDFDSNSDQLSDKNGHGTHVSGIIAAEANNNKGIAGVASHQNVKIMGIRIMNNSGEYITSYADIMAYNYIIKAKKRGVNIIAVNNSWGARIDCNSVYEDMLELAGKEGIISFCAAGNDGVDLDKNDFSPGSMGKQYSVVVGAVNDYGNITNYSNYGCTMVDIMAPGNSILSTYKEGVYFPTHYTKERLCETTEYFGRFDSSTTVVDNKVIPTTGEYGELVKQFGESRFVVKKDSAEDTIPSKATCELVVDKNVNFMKTKNPGALRVRIKNASKGEKYYLFFPYKDNYVKPEEDNTKIFLENDILYKNDVDLDVNYKFGKINVDKDGDFHFAGETKSISASRIKKILGTMENYLEVNDERAGYESETVETGVGLELIKSDDNDKNIEFYLSALAVSKSDYEDKENNYSRMNGTSMATPIALGAYVNLYGLGDKKEGQTDEEYALETIDKLKGCVVRTDELSDKCATGGYIDL